MIDCHSLLRHADFSEICERKFVTARRGVMNIDEKKIFRKQMLAKRDAIPPENRIEADRLRNEIIRTWEVYQSAELLLFYVSYRSEADTIQLLKQALAEGRNVAVPKVEGKEMVFYRITEFSQLVEGYRGILEPDIKKVVPITKARERSKAQDTKGQTVKTFGKLGEGRLPKRTLLFVPGCAFDEQGGRMGYGGGFYDRFMEKYPDVKRVALSYEMQLVDIVPCEIHDRRVDVIVTEKRRIELKNGRRNAALTGAFTEKEKGKTQKKEAEHGKEENTEKR